MHRRLLVLPVLVSAALFVASARGAVITYTAVLTGPGESPANGSPGTGLATVDVDPVANTMHVHVTFQDLTGTTTASHIHSPTPAPFTLTAGVATTTPTFAGFPLGVSSGTFDNTLDMTLASSYNASFISANGGTTASAETALFSSIAAGTSYLNIHTTTFPGGEIRGFLAVPEPASLGLLACAGLIVSRRRCRRG
jgi:hypothetical protein